MYAIIIEQDGATTSTKVDFEEINAGVDLPPRASADALSDVKLALDALANLDDDGCDWQDVADVAERAALALDAFCTTAGGGACPLVYLACVDADADEIAGRMRPLVALVTLAGRAEDDGVDWQEVADVVEAARAALGDR